MERTAVLTGIGAVGAVISSALGGWDTGLITLLIFMAADYVTGLMLAGVWKKSPKTESGALSSDAGLKGLCKKAVMLLLVLVAVRVDLLLGVDYLRDAVVIALCVNELLSIIENAGLMGAPVPTILKRAIDLLNKKADREEKNA